MTSAPTPAPREPLELALAPALRARLLGAGLVATGLVVLVGVLVAALAGGSGVLVAVLVVLALLAVVGLALLLGVRRWVLRLDEHGYRVRGLRSAQARTARWVDVLDLQTAEVAGSRCLVLRLRDGRRTTLPVDALEGDPQALTTTVGAYLDRGHGYRRLG